MSFYEYKTVMKSEKETIMMGREFAASAYGGMVIILNGELGAGKTTFAKGFAKGLKIKYQITSPTYTILNCFNGRLKLNHFDFYRLKSSEELENIGYSEKIYGDEVSLIEWGNLFNGLLPDNRIEIFFEISGKKSRSIKIKAFGEKEIEVCKKVIK